VLVLPSFPCCLLTDKLGWQVSNFFVVKSFFFLSLLFPVSIAPAFRSLPQLQPGQAQEMLFAVNSKSNRQNTSSARLSGRSSIGFGNTNMTNDADLSAVQVFSPPLL
jgi:hypothetical protein